jgi:hypothetical protein
MGNKTPTHRMIQSVSSHYKWIVFVSLLLSSCSEEKGGIPDPTGEKVRKQVTEAVSNATPSGSHGNSSRNDENVYSRDKIIDDVREALLRLSNGGDKISVFKNEWNSLSHPTLLIDRTSPEDIENALSPSQKSLVEELKDPSSKWSADAGLRRALGVLLSLTVALAGSDGMEFSRFPEILSDIESRATVTEGDVLLLKILVQAMALADSRPTLPDERLGDWTRIAGSLNPICRAIALVSFYSMRTTPSQQGTFYATFVGEASLPLAKVFIGVVRTADQETAARLLTQFKSKSPASPQLVELIDQALSALKR